MCFSEWCVQRVVRICKGRKNQNAFKHCSFQAFFVPLYPLSQAEVRNLKNTVWKIPFGTLRYLTALAGQSSQGRTPTRPKDKRDEMTILLWNSAGNGRFAPGTGPGLSKGRFPFVPDTVPPNMFMFIVFLSRFKHKCMELFSGFCVCNHWKVLMMLDDS